MANYPSANPSFATKNPGGTIQSAHINALQDEVVAIGTDLRGGLQHALTVPALTVSSNVGVTGVLTVAGQPRMHVQSSVTQSISSSNASTGVRVTFDTESFDVGAGYSTANNEYVTPSSGCYLIKAHVHFTQGDPEGNLAIFVGGAATALGYFSTRTQDVEVSVLVNVNAASTFSVHVLPNSTVARTIGATATPTYKTFSVVKLG
jgi:hypothetical protein